jgi:hypothetical protein
MTTQANLFLNAAAFCKANPGHSLFIPRSILPRGYATHDAQLALERLGIQTTTAHPYKRPGLWAYSPKPQS